jgi:cytochrome c-type biogenesis protein CcmH
MWSARPAARALRRAALQGAALLGAALLAAGSACDRGVEPFDPNERVAEPDLSKIFPPGAERAPKDQAMAARGAPPPGAPGAPGATPGMAGAPAGTEAAAGDPIRGRILLAGALEGRVPEGAVLFLVARTSDAGPPVAVKRVPDPVFPLSFEIGPGDRMMQGIPFTGPFQLTARVDADGNAATRNPGDLQGASPGRVETGTRDVEVVIDQVL